MEEQKHAIKDGKKSVLPEAIDVDDFNPEDGAKKPLGDATHAGDLGSLETSSESPDSSGEDEEEEKPLISPSTDIRADFQLALEDGFEFEGAFAHLKTFSMKEAPNPCLHVANLGTIGLPLSEREACAIIASCTRSLDSGSGQGAAGICEVPAEKIRFENPEWDIWLQSQVVPDLCKALGTNGVARPDLQLTHLSLRGPGSTTTYPKDIRTSDAKFGTLDLSLPSRFTGGQHRVSHAGQTITNKASQSSPFSTSILASYVGVEHKLEPVDSGFRLALSYDLLQPMTHAAYRPALPELQGAKQKLRHVLRSWKQDADDTAPRILPCLLQHKYSKKDFRAQSLTGADALLVSHLRPIARELHFKACLAHITVFETAKVSLPEQRLWEDGYSDYDDADDLDPEDFDMVDSEQELSIEQVVDLDGMPVIVSELCIDLEDLSRGSGSWRDFGPDSKDLDPDDYYGTLSHTYHRAVLLLWPKNSGVQVRVGDVYKYACAALKTSLSFRPTKKELKLVDGLIEWCAMHPEATENELKRAVSILRESADRWNDAQLLLKAVRACRVSKNINLMGIEGFVSAYQAFGWENLHEFYTEAVKHDVANLRRYALVNKMKEVAKEEDNQVLNRWCVQQEGIVLRSLKKVDHDQIEWLITLAKERGGMFLQATIMPQLAIQSLAQSFWTPFVIRLTEEKANIPQSYPELIVNLVRQSVENAIAACPAFPVKNPVPFYSYQSMEQIDVDPIMQLIKLCVATNNLSSCSKLFKKLQAASMSPFRQKATFAPWKYFDALVLRLDDYIRLTPGLDAFLPTFAQFFSIAITVLGEMNQVSPPAAVYASPPPEPLKSLVLSLQRAGGISVLKNMLSVDRVDRLARGKALRSLVLLVVSSLKPSVEDAAAIQDYAVVVNKLVESIISHFDIKALLQQQALYYGSQPQAPTQIIDIVKLCFQVGAQMQCQYLFQRLINPPVGTVMQSHISNALVPFIDILCPFLLTHGISLTTEPWKAFCSAVVKLYASTVMTQKPPEAVSPEQLQTIGCGCSECIVLKSFFMSEKETISFQRVQNIRTHLERQLLKAFAWGVRCETLRLGSPHTLVVKKPPSMTATGLWAANSAKGQALLKALGDTAIQRQIIGDDFATIHAKIVGSPSRVAQPHALLGEKRPSADLAASSHLNKKPRQS